MKKLLILILPLIGLFGCAAQKTTPEPTGKYVWTHPELYKQADFGKVSEAELDHEFLVAKSTCKIEKLKLPIPSPSCSTIPAPSCSGLTGFALGMCQSRSSYQKCNYSSVNAARDAQNEIYESCMGLEGWKQKWVEFNRNEKQEVIQEAKTIDGNLDLASSKVSVIPLYEQELLAAGNYHLFKKTERSWWCARSINAFYHNASKEYSLEMKPLEWRMHFITLALAVSCDKAKDGFDLINLTNTWLNNAKSSIGKQLSQ